MIVTLITLGKNLESYSKGKTTDALKKSYEDGSKDCYNYRKGFNRKRKGKK